MNFMLAGIIGIPIVFVTDLLRAEGWEYSTIGLATAAVGIGVAIFQTPAGMIVDRIQAHRAMAFFVALFLGLCYGLVPFVPARTEWLIALLFGAGVSQAFVAPLFTALALDLAGHAGFKRMFGSNQAWNHVGAIAASTGTLLLAASVGVRGIFAGIFVASLFGAAAPVMIRRGDLRPVVTDRVSRERGASL
jgi:MFS family permease